MLLPVVMAGGSGTRLWPLSRTLYPKQFLSLNSRLTMLQETLRRLDKVEHKPALVICNESHRFIVAEQLRKESLKHSGILLEPVGRNTAPAVALAALQAMVTGDDPILLVLAADHEIQDEDNFIAAVLLQRILQSRVSLLRLVLFQHPQRLAMVTLSQVNLWMEKVTKLRLLLKNQIFT